MSLFELKKTIKNKSLLIFPILALLLAIYGNFFNTNPINPPQLRNGATSHHLLQYVISEQPNLRYEYNFESGMELLVGGTPEMEKDYIDLVSMLPKIDYTNMNPYDNSVPILTSSFPKGLLGFIDKYDLQVSETLMQDIVYSEKAYHFLEENSIDIKTFLNEDKLSLQDILLANADVYFGFIPIAAVLIVMAYSISREYEKGSIYFESLLPQDRKRILLNKLATGLLLGIIYLVSLFLFSFIFGLVKGNIDFYALYPLKVFSLPNKTISFIGLLGLICLIFITKSLLFIVIGLLIGLFIKRVSLVQIVLAFVLTLGFIITSSIHQLQTIFNPFYSHYTGWILGSSFVNTKVTSGYLYEYLSPNFSWLYLMYFIVLSIVILLICFKLIQPDQKINTTDHYKVSTKKKSLFGWELYKQRRYVNFTVIGSLILVLLLTLLFTATQGDQYVFEQQILNKFSKEQITSRIESININKELSEEALKGDLSQEDKDYHQAMIQSYENDLQVAESSLEQMSALENIYNTGDSKAFYQNLHDSYLTKQNDPTQQIIGLGAPESFKINPNTLVNGEISEFSKQASDTFRNKLLESDLKPLPLIFERTLTYYDKTTDINELNDAIDSQLPSDSSSFMLLYRLFETRWLGIILIVISVFLFSGSYYLDFETGNQLNFLNTQPIKKTTLYERKYGSALLSILMLLSLVLIFLLGVGLLSNPSNTLNFPILKYVGLVDDPMLQQDYAQYYQYISLVTYLVQSLLLIGACILFVFSFAQMLSTKIKSRALIYLIILGLFGLLYLLLALFPGLAGVNPISYFFINDVIKGSMAVRFGYLGVDFGIGIILLISLSIITFFIGRLFSKTI